MSPKVVRLGLVLLMLTFLGACVFDWSTSEPTPTKAFVEASQTFANAWESYHTVWLALPQSDPRKAAWLKAYHPKFDQAAAYLELWGKNFNDPTKQVGWDSLAQVLQGVLIELAIKKGGN